MKTKVAFWEQKKVDELSTKEWEMLCDNCGQCCVYRLLDDSGEILQTNVVCRYYDFENGRCSDYKNRHKLNANCVPFDYKKANSFEWLPKTCAYRRVALNQPLPVWHSLITGKETPKAIKINIKDYVLEYDGIVLEDHIIE
ncbi:MAG: YcgN family cysteine cluster protein [Campylobacterales bacterium]|nr:YcgN family cysteine cluster protein [Campylobacterales bacterium]